MTNHTSPSESKVSSRDSAYQKLRAAIIQGSLGPGMSISEVTVADQFGLSRTPLREALVRLEREGLTTSEYGKGFCVSQLSASEATDIYSMLGNLERFALNQSDRFRPADVKEMSALNRQMKQCKSRMQRIELDERIHESFTRRCPNKPLQRFLGELRGRVMRYELVYSEQHTLVRSYNEHIAIISCLRNGETKNAAELLERHWIESTSILTELIESRHSPPER